MIHEIFGRLPAVRIFHSRCPQRIPPERKVTVNALEQHVLSRHVGNLHQDTATVEAVEPLAAEIRLAVVHNIEGVHGKENYLAEA